MDSDQRTHFRTPHNTTTTNELLICFASRLSSSSSMKLSKSITSPARAASGPGQPSLSSSLSRRLRASGSLKGGASPFLTTAGKRRSGAGFENPEPSSPKVTCIGQVRVKTKKKVKQTRSLSKRRSGDLSFRKIEHQHSGPADFNNINGGGDRDSNKIRYSGAASGGAHYQPGPQQGQPECLPHRNQRWVHLPISICEALRDFSCLLPCKTSSCFSRDKVEDENKSEEENGCGAVFRWLVSVNDGEGGRRREIELVVGGGDEEEESVSMRNSRRHVFDDIEVRDDRVEVKGRSLDGHVENARGSVCIPPKNALLLMRCRSDPMKMASLATKFSWDGQEDCEIVVEEKIDDLNECGEGEKDVELEGEAEVEAMFVEEQDVSDEENTENLEKEIVTEEEEFLESDNVPFEVVLDQENVAQDCKDITNYDDSSNKMNKEEIDSSTIVVDKDNEENQEKSEAEEPEERQMLPECLLLMMCEPKLSMEVSKETWVCSTDFIRCVPERPPMVKVEVEDGGDKEIVKRRLSVDFKVLPPLSRNRSVQQPPRLSCSLPAVIEQKLVNAVGYEPFVLTRCKSEPMRTAAVKLMPESCLVWNNAVTKMEVGAAAGVGF